LEENETITIRLTNFLRSVMGKFAGHSLETIASIAKVSKEEREGRTEGRKEGRNVGRLDGWKNRRLEVRINLDEGRKGGKD
jgi:hypothetical protein